MTIIAKERSFSEENSFELFSQVDVLDDMTGEVIWTKNQSIWHYSIPQLDAIIADAQTKKDAILGLQ